MRDIRDFIDPLTSAIIIFCKAHGMACATRVTNNNLRNNFYGNLFSVSNEISPILVAHFLRNECWKVPTKTLGSLSKKLVEKEKKKKKLKSKFLKAFCVMRKRNNP